MEILNYITDHIYEFFGVLFSIIYVILSIRQNIFCWPALIIAAILNCYAFYLIELPLQSIMQLFFICVGISGWISWTKIDDKKNIVKKWRAKQITFWLTGGFILTLLLTQILILIGNSPSHLSSASSLWEILQSLQSKHPFFDSLMFMFNIIPMYMTTKKVIQSWLIFIVIDVVSGFFYLYTGDYFYCFLFFFYIPFATHGYLSWKKDLINNEKKNRSQSL